MARGFVRGRLLERKKEREEGIGGERTRLMGRESFSLSMGHVPNL